MNEDKFSFKRFGFYLFLMAIASATMVYGAIDGEVDDKDVVGIVGTTITVAAAAYRGNNGES